MVFVDGFRGAILECSFIFSPFACPATAPTSLEQRLSWRVTTGGVSTPVGVNSGVRLNQLCPAEASCSVAPRCRGPAAHLSSAVNVMEQRQKGHPFDASFNNSSHSRCHLVLRKPLLFDRRTGGNLRAHVPDQTKEQKPRVTAPRRSWNRSWTSPISRSSKPDSDKGASCRRFSIAALKPSRQGLRAPP